MSRTSVLFLAVFLVAAAAAAVLVWRAAGEDKARLTTGDGRFERVLLGYTRDLFSVGVADFTADGQLDVFTTNHGFAALYLENLGGLDFADRRVALGLSSNADFPDAEIADAAPAMEDPGLYLFWQAGAFRMISVGLDLDAPVDIAFALGGGILPRGEGAIEVVEHSETEGEYPTRLIVRVSGGGALTLRSLRWFVDGEVALDPTLDLKQVFVGAGAVSPTQARFALSPGADRHGVAWTDLDEDRRTDAIFVDGGEVGQMRHPRPYPVAFSTEQGFKGPATVPGLVQELCPSRQVLLGDADGDGLEDVYVVCGRGEPPRADHPNELFLRQSDGSFVNRAREMGLDLPGPGVARWFDAEADGNLELLWANSQGISVLARQGGRYQEVFFAPRPGPKAQLAAGDLDGDPYPDFYIAASNGASAVLLNSGGEFRLVEPESLGLPEAAQCAALVDIDNDGQDEFHALPAGLYKRGAEGFVPTGLLQSGPYPAFCLWFDADNDGTLDLLAALPATDPLAERVGRKIAQAWEGLRYGGRHSGRVYRPWRWELALYRTAPSPNAWLSVALEGPSGNSSGTGALITVQAGERAATRQVVLAEGSTASHGLFRTHFGLGQADSIAELSVQWPDGTVQEVRPPQPNQLLTIPHPSLR